MNRKITIYAIFFFLVFFSFDLFTKNLDEYNPNNNEIDHLNSAFIFYDIEVDDLDPSKNWEWAVNQSWCSGSGTLNDPYIIENHIFTYQDGSGNGLLIENSNQYFVIRNCTFTECLSGGSFPYYAGLKLNNVSNGLIQDCEFTSNEGRGIILYDSDNNQIFNNTISDNRHGIALASLCDYNIISDNIIENNYLSGINFETTLAYENNYNEISSNWIHLNNGNGITLGGRNDFNLIVNNDIHNNGIGLAIFSNSDNNTCYLNFFIGNDENGRDYGLDNKWDNNSIGNYWDDYHFDDNDGDGIGDQTYIYVENLRDYLPIVDNTPPNITIVYPNNSQQFTKPPTFEVSIKEKYPNLMWYTINNGDSKFYFYIKDTILENLWNSVPSGNVVIKFYANDRALNEAFEQITIIKPLSISFGILPLLLFSILGTITFIIIVKRRVN